jgi:hypothetical protein
MGKERGKYYRSSNGIIVCCLENVSDCPRFAGMYVFVPPGIESIAAFGTINNYLSVESFSEDVSWFFTPQNKAVNKIATASISDLKPSNEKIVKIDGSLYSMEKFDGYKRRLRVTASTEFEEVEADIYTTEEEVSGKAGNALRKIFSNKGFVLAINGVYTRERDEAAAEIIDMAFAEPESDFTGLKLYSVDFKGVMPAASVLILLARNEEEAIKMASETIGHTDDYTVEEVIVTGPQIVIYEDGDY